MADGRSGSGRDVGWILRILVIAARIAVVEPPMDEPGEVVGESIALGLAVAGIG